MATSKVRVLRLLEYTYDSVGAMERDRTHWAIQGDRKYGATRIKSVTLPLEVLETPDPDPDDVDTGAYGNGLPN